MEPMKGSFCVRRFVNDLFQHYVATGFSTREEAEEWLRAANPRSNLPISYDVAYIPTDEERIISYANHESRKVLTVSELEELAQYPEKLVPLIADARVKYIKAYEDAKDQLIR